MAHPLDVETRALMESRFGHDFSGVRVHNDGLAAESALAVNALAYTVGQHVVFGEGQYAPKTESGRRLLAHELTHTLQQSEGSISSSPIQIVERDDPAENEAQAFSQTVATRCSGTPPARKRELQLARQTSPIAGRHPSPKTTAQEIAHAKKEHEVQQARVAKLIERGVSAIPDSADPAHPDLLFRNSAQWVWERRSPTCVLTQTHDATSRKAGSVALFDVKVKYPEIGGEYDEQPSPKDVEHIKYVPVGFLGTESVGEIDLIDPARQSDEELKLTIVHEVQHAADQIGWGQPGRVQGTPGLTGSAMLISEQDYNNYQTEFRAYWVSEASVADTFGSERKGAQNSRPVRFVDGKTNQTLSATTHFSNERQEKIFWHLAANYPRVAEVYTRDAAYRSMVDRFDRPVGINLVDSLRIQDVSEALKSCRPEMTAETPEVKRLFAAVATLDDADLNFLRNSTSSKPFWMQASAALSLKWFTKLQTRVSRIGDFPPDPSMQLMGGKARV
jgi:hypothetical protein